MRSRTACHLWNPIEHRGGRRGYSCIEILVVIAVVAVLCSLAIVVGGTVRRRSIMLLCHANLHQIGQAVHHYVDRNRDVFPYLAMLGQGPPLRNGGYAVGYFAQEVLWPKAFQGEFENDQLSMVTQCPASPTTREIIHAGRLVDYLSQYGPTYVEPSSYWLSGTVLADPSLFRESEHHPPDTLFRATRSAEVLFPAAKGIFAEVRSYHHADASFGSQISPDASLLTEVPGRVPFAIWFLDGHVAEHRRGELTPGVRITPQASPTPVLRTPNGIRGRDVP
jgi:hypothetical protein